MQTPHREFCDSYFYDDLLVNTTREIIVNGMSTDNIPQTIKDWVSGKVLSSLPEQLVKRLINFVFDNRDHSQIAYKENRAGDEFTMLVYRTERQFRTREKLLLDDILKRDHMNQKEYDKMFNEYIDTNENSLAYFADELICEAGASIPMTEAVKISKQIMEYNNKDYFNIDGARTNFDAPKSLMQEIQDSHTPQSRIKVNQKTRLPNNQPSNQQVQNEANGPTPKKRKTSSGTENTNRNPYDPNPGRSAAERLAAWNQAHRNAKEENLEAVTEEDREKLAQLNALAQTEGAEKMSLNVHLESDEENNSKCSINNPDGKKKRKHRLRIPEPIACPVCDKLYPGKRKGLWDHMKIQHKAEWPSYWAANRPKTARLAQMDEYQEHFRIDPKSGDYICIPCGGKFTAATRFLKHLRKTHLGIKDYWIFGGGKSSSSYQKIKMNIPCRVHFLITPTTSFSMSATNAGKNLAV